MARFDHLTQGEVRIPALAPYGLDLVPAYRLDPATGQEDETWRGEWFAWRDAVLKVRNDVQERCQRDPLFLEEEYQRCSDDPGWFITMWLWVEEPRADDENLTGDDDFDPLKPFIPYAPQVRLVYLVHAILSLRSRHDLLVDKARGFGVSYIMAAVLFWRWLFRKGRYRYLSQKLEKADRAHDLDSLFAKIDLFMRYLPARFIPAGFNRGTKGRAVKHRQSAMFKNPATDAQITAEATTGDSVRGGRATGVFNDEAAFQEQYRAARATIGGATNHRIDWSSASLVKGRQWLDTWTTAKKVNQRLRDEGQEPVATVIEIDWWESPYQDAQWYAETRAAYESDGNLEEFATEFERNPHQHGTHVYPQARSCPDVDAWFDPHRMLYVAVDPGMADDCGWVFWQTHFVDGKKRIRWLDSFIRNRLPAEWYAHVLTGIMPEPEDISYIYADELLHPEMQYFMRWLKDVPSHMMTIYADPAIESLDAGASSFKKRFVLTSQTITERAGLGTRAGREVVNPYSAIYRKNTETDRRFALRKGLMISEFSLTDGAQQLKTDIAEVRFGEVTERTSLAPKIRHDRHRHRCTAAEYGMVYDDLLILSDADLRPPEPAKPGRQGRTPPHRQRRDRRDDRRPRVSDPIGVAA